MWLTGPGEWASCSLGLHCEHQGGAKKKKKEQREKSLKVDAAKCFKITNDSFGAITSQSCEPLETEATGSRERAERAAQWAQ